MQWKLCFAQRLNRLGGCYTSPSEHPDYSIYLEVCKSREAGKSTTWIVENVLKMGGRKFSDGKVKLQTLLNKFEEEK
jgi:hypothetical protein